MHWAARLIETEFDTMFYRRGERETLQRWFSLLPTDVRLSRPRLLVAQAALDDSNGRLDAVDALLTKAEHIPADFGDRDEPFVPTSGPAGSMLINVPAATAIFRAFLAESRGDGDAASEFAARARAVITEDQSMLAHVAAGHLAVADWVAGRLEDSEQALSASMARWRAEGYRNLMGWGAYHLGRVQLALGRLDAAETIIGEPWMSRRTTTVRRCPQPGWDMQAWPRSRTSAVISRRHRRWRCVASRCAADSASLHRWPLRWLAGPGSSTPAETPRVPRSPWRKPTGPGLM